MQLQTKDWVTEGARKSIPIPSLLSGAAPGVEVSPKNASVGPSNERSRYPVRWTVEEGSGVARSVREGLGEWESSVGVGAAD